MATTFKLYGFWLMSPHESSSSYNMLLEALHLAKSRLKMSFSMKTKGVAIIQVRPLLVRVRYIQIGTE